MFFNRKTHNNEAKKLPKSVREYMRHRFILLPEYLDTLRCFEYDGRVDDKRVRCIHIFSPYLAREYRLSITTDLDLQQHPEVLLYEGYIDDKGKVYVADRRMMSCLEKLSSQRT